MGSNAYVVTREHDGCYQLHATVPGSRLIARITPVRDRTDRVLAWKLKPLVVMQDDVSRLWPDPAAAIAATKLFTAGNATAAVRAAQRGEQP